MSLQLKHALVCGFLLLLPGCGFHPMYGDSAAGEHSAMRGNIIIDPMPGHEGQMFKTALEDKFNPQGISTANAQYHLAIILTKVQIPAVVKSDGTIQRYDVRFDTRFNLFKVGDKTALFSGRVIHSGSYNVAINANFASYEAEQDVIERLLQEMSEDYTMRISGYLESHAEIKPPPTPAPLSTVKPLTP